MQRPYGSDIQGWVALRRKPIQGKEEMVLGDAMTRHGQIYLAGCGWGHAQIKGQSMLHTRMGI